MLDHPELPDWGLSEIAGVTVEPAPLPDRGGYRVTVSWDGGRRLRILAATVEIAPSD
jgi:hypothetical protein